MTERIAYSIKEFAQAIGAAENTVRAAIKRGEYPVERVGRRQFIPVSVVKKFVEKSDADGDNKH